MPTTAGVATRAARARARPRRAAARSCRRRAPASAAAAPPASPPRARRVSTTTTASAIATATAASTSSSPVASAACDATSARFARVVAVPARERVEQHGDRLEHEHVDVGGGDEQRGSARVRAARSGTRAARGRAPRRRGSREHADRVRGGAVGVVQRAEQRREPDRGEQQAEAGVRRRAAARARPAPTNVRQTTTVSDGVADRVRRDAADGDRVDGGARRRERATARPAARRPAASRPSRARVAAADAAACSLTRAALRAPRRRARPWR